MLYYDPTVSDTLSDMEETTTDTFTYTLTDGNSGTSVTGTVTVTINGSSTPGEATIVLNGDSISVSGSGATASGSTVTITSAGTYTISGTLNDGQVIVDSDDEEDVTLILNGVDITCSDIAPIYVVNAANAVITLADGTVNYITDGDTYTYESADIDEPNAAIYSGDGIQTSNAEDSTKGYATIVGGTVDITAGSDGIQAETTILITGGDVTISAGGGSSSGSTDSGKGLKAVLGVTIEGGTVEVDSADDAVHPDGSITITGGSTTLASADDAIHGETSVAISGGTISVTTCYEGIDSPTITIDDATVNNDGEITVDPEPQPGEDSTDGRITLIAPQSDPDISDSGGLTGFAYLDGDGDGDWIRDDGECGITGAQITLTGSGLSGNALDLIALTQGDGSCSFDGLTAGTYQLTERQPAAMSDGQDSTTASGATVSDDTIMDIVLESGAVSTGNNFGEAGFSPSTSRSTCSSLRRHLQKNAFSRRLPRPRNSAAT